MTTIISCYERNCWRKRHGLPIYFWRKNMELKIDTKPDAWASKTMCIGPDYGKTRYDKLPIQSLNPLYYTHEKLYSEKSVIGLMKAAHYDGYTEREKELREAAWQPIATAPKDCRVLIGRGGYPWVFSACWSERHKHWATGNSPMDFFAEPTHWMLSPEPPND